MNGAFNVNEWINNIQDVLNYRIQFGRIGQNSLYNNKNGIGRAGLTGFLLGTGFGVHFTALIFIIFWGDWSSKWIQAFVSFIVISLGLYWILYLIVMFGCFCGQITWTQYFFLLCLFHFLEFFITSTSQPSKATADCMFNVCF
jgi:hypothetical protein